MEAPIEVACILWGEAWAVAHKMLCILMMLWDISLTCTVIIRSLKDQLLVGLGPPGAIDRGHRSPAVTELHRGGGEM